MKNTRYILYVDTSIVGFNAAIYQSSKDKLEYTCRDQWMEFDNKTASTNIASTLKILLDRNSLNILDENLDFCFARGPGSFTGIKVGVAAMLAIKFSRESLSRSINFTSVSAMSEIWKSLGASQGFSDYDREVVLPASRNEFYSCYFDKSLGRVTEEVFDLRDSNHVKRWLNLNHYICFLSPWPELQDFLQSKSRPSIAISTEQWFRYTGSDSMLLSLRDAKWNKDIGEINFLRDASPIQNKKNASQS